MRLITKWMLALTLLIVSIGANAEKKYLTFSTEDYCAAKWNAETNTLTWGSGGWNSAWTFMAAKDVSGDLSAWEKLHLNAKSFTNSKEEKLTVVFKKNDGSQPPSGPTKEFVVSPDANGDINIDLTTVEWGDCDITKIQDLTIYGGERTDASLDASVVITDAYLEKTDPVADDVLPIDIQFGANYNGRSVGDYTSTWTATKDGKTWSIANFNNNNNQWNSIKCGRKNNTSVASITSPAINAVVKSYVITLNKASNVNSAKLFIMNGEEKVDSADITANFVTGDVVVPVESQKGYSYVLTIDNKSASSNGSVEISKILLSGETIQPVEPVTIKNTAETAYTVAKAIELIEAGEALGDSVYVKGIVCQVDTFIEKYKSISYWISENGKTDGQKFECYSGKGINGADFASIDDVKVGAEVIVKGLLKKFTNKGDTIYEFNSNNKLVSYKAPAAPEPVDTVLVKAQDDLKAAIATAKATTTEGMTEESVKALTDAIAAAEAALVAEGATAESLTAAKTDVENAIAGLTVKPLLADGKYYIYNVGTQKYLAAGSNWGTHAVVNETGLDYGIALADGKYTLDSQVSNGGVKNFLNGEWNDGVAFGWTLAEVAEGIFTISDGTNYLTAGANDVVTLAADATVEAAQWKVIPADSIIAAKLAAFATATAENGVDATFLIKGANFNRNDLRNSAWTHTRTGGNETFAGPSEERTTFGCEYWNNTFEVSQTIENVLEGIYEFSIAGFATNGTAKIFVNETEADFVNTGANDKNFRQVLDAIAAGEFTGNTTGKVNVIGGTLKIGVKRAENKAQDWTTFDNARLTYYGPVSADAYKPAFETALAAAQAALTAEEYAAITGEEKAALQTAIATNTTVAEEIDSLKAAIAALTEATNAFKAVKAAYNELAAAKNLVATITYNYASAEKKAAAEATLTAEATNAADATTKTAAIYKAYRQYAESSAMLEGVEGAFDMTNKIVNPKAEQNIAEPWVVVKGEGSGGGLDVKNGEPWTDGADNATHKYFDGGDWGAQAWNVGLEQKIALPKGKYLLSAKGRASADVALTLFADSFESGIPSIGASGGLFNRGWNDASVEFTLAEADTITIGVRGITSVVHNWMSFSDFRLVKFPVETPAVASIKASIGINERFTSVAALEGQNFAIINEAEGKALYGSGAQNLGYDTYANAFSSSNAGYLWKLVSLADNADESIRGYYMLRLVTPKGEEYNIWGSPGFLNSQAADGWCSFILGLAKGTGQDIVNGAVFDVQYEEGKGFSLKNIGTGLYKGANTGTANAAEPVYFTFASVSSTYAPAVEALLAEGEAWKAIVKDETAVATYNTAVEGIDPANLEGDGQAEAKKIDAAIVELVKAQPAEEGANFTRAIVNPSFEFGNIDGWTNQDGGWIQGSDAFGARTGSFFVEKWTANTGKLSNGSFLQTVAGLPTGKYQLTAEMQNREQGNNDAAGTGLFLVANEGKTEAISNNGETFKVIGTNKKGELQIGAVLDSCSGNWICFDNFKLTYVEALPAGFLAAQAALETAIAEANAIDTVGKQGIGDLAAAIAAAETALNAADATTESLTDAKTTLETAVAAFTEANKPVEIAHTWNFTKWSEATVANLKADAAASKVAGWSDVEKKADAEADAAPTEAAKDNCFWYVGGEAEPTANGEAIAELKGLEFNTTYGTSRALAIAVNYQVPDSAKSFGPYNGPAYLWLGGNGQTVMTIKNVKVGTTITMGVESHKITDARGVQLFVGDAELMDTLGQSVAAPKTYTEQTWTVPAGKDVVDVIVKNTNGCHIYFIDAEIGEPAPAPVDSALIAAKDALLAVIAADKTIQTEGQQGADALATAIATAEGAANAADATVESIAAARAALAAAVATFTKANIGADFAEIPQDQGKDINDGATRASVVEGEGYTQYTTDGGVCVIIKKYDVDVKNCDYVTIKFAEPVPAGICAAFWAQSGTDNVGITAGAFEYKYVFADDAKCAIANDVLPQLTLLTLWNSQTVNIVGVYKHYTEDYMTRINTLKTQRENGAIFNLNGQKMNKAQKGLYIINGKKTVVR